MQIIESKFFLIAIPIQQILSDLATGQVLSHKTYFNYVSPRSHRVYEVYYRGLLLTGWII